MSLHKIIFLLFFRVVCYLYALLYIKVEQFDGVTYRIIVSDRFINACGFQELFEDNSKIEFYKTDGKARRYHIVEINKSKILIKQEDDTYYLPLFLIPSFPKNLLLLVIILSLFIIFFRNLLFV